MGERVSKITALLVFVLVAGLLAAVNFLIVQKNTGDVYRHIRITGNNLLPSESYLEFCVLSDPDDYSELEIASVKRRFEEHPYVAKADVKFDGVDCIDVNLFEKEIKATLLLNNNLKMISSDFEVLPVFAKTIIHNVPIISHLKIKPSGNSTEIRNIPGIVQSFKIIDAVELSDHELYEKLSEINLMNGGNIVLTFKGIKCPVVFGRNDEAQKIYALSRLIVQSSVNENLFKNLDYIDLRYSNKIFLGKKESENIKG